MLPFIVIGLADGSIYAVAALGLALSYKTSGVFNFAHGAIAAGGAYVFYQCHMLWGWPWPVALVVSVLGYGMVAGLLLERFAARLEHVPTSLRIVGTVGLLIAIQYAAWVHYGTRARSFPAFLPTRSFHLPGVNVQMDQIILVLVALGAAGGLSAFFRYSRLGVAMRAIVDDSALLDLTGTKPARVRRAAWLIGSCFASLSGVLIAPKLGLDAGLLTLLVVQAYAAAAVGAFTNLPLVYAGGLLVGIVQQLVYYGVGKSGISTLGSLPTSMPFIILFVVLLVLPRSKLPEIGRRIRPRPPKPAPGGLPLRAGVVAVAGLLLAVVPFTVGSKLPIYTDALTVVILFLSLALLVRTSNQISLCQAGFAAVGAAAFGHFAGRMGVPWPLALLLAGLVAVPLGAFVAFPAIRLAGLFLALATFGFGILLEQVVYRSFLMFGPAGGLKAPRPDLPGLDLQGDRGYYYVVLAVVVLAAFAVVAVERSRLGRLLRGLGDSPVALATHGASVNVTRVIVFCISAFLAGIGGALFAPLNGSVNGTTFPSFNSVALLAVLAVATFSLDLVGGGAIAASFVAAGLFKVLPGYVTNADMVLYLQILFGATAVIAAVTAAGPRRTWRGALVARSQSRTGRGPVQARTASLARTTPTP